MNSIAGKSVLVTGGHKRLGRAIALHLARHGADIVISWRRDPDQAQETLALLHQTGIRASAFACDLTASPQIEALVAHAVAFLGRLDAVVASAASFVPTGLDTTSLAQLPAIMAANATGPLQLALAARAHLTRCGDGRLVLLGDMAGTRPLRGYLGHSMAKAALHNAVMGLAAELAPAIVVNCVAPGAVLRPAEHSEEHWRKLVARNPLGALALRDGQLPVAAVAAAVEFFLACPPYITGQTLHVDGGRSAVW